MADQLQDFVQHMLDAGAPKETIDEGIRLFQSQHAPQAVASDEPDTYLGGALKGFKEGAVGGATGFVKGVAPGVVEGVKGVVTGPLALAKGAYHAAMNPSQAVSDALDAVKAAPGKVADMTSAAAHKAAVDPEGFGNDVGNITGSALGGIAAGRAVPLAVKPAARMVGTGLQYAGEHPFATRMSGGAGVVTGMATGRPELVLGGLAAQAIPPMATKAGQALRIYGGESPAVVRLGAAGAAKLNSQFDEAMVKRGMDFYDERAAATKDAAKRAANDERLAAIEEAKKGMEAGTPNIRETVAADLPDGSKSSMSTSFKKAEEAAAPGGPPPGWPPGVPYDPSKLVGGIQPLRGGPKVVTLGGGPARPSIRIVGKAATDLAAEPGIVPNEGVHSAPPVIDPAAQAVRDQTAPMGKAASDVAEGKVPTASSAPTPSDTRLDELVGKFAEGPKPARVTTQEAIPATKSKGPKSATPGLTRADLQEAGLNPDLNYKDLTPEMVEKIKANRASRHQTNYTNAVSDRRFGTTRDDLKSILEQSLLMNMDRLR